MFRAGAVGEAMKMILLGCVAAMMAFGCGDGTGDEPANHDSHANHMTQTDVDVYADSIMKMGVDGNVHVMIMSANPAPPDVGDNTWMLRIVDMDDNPIDGATVTVTPFMPAHGHGTSPADFKATFSEDGTYEAGPFKLFMPGVWETTVDVAGDAADSVMFSFDLEG